MPHDLPGTDPRFHEARKYLTPMRYKGQSILASHGSCKQAGCGYSSAWTNNAARDRGMWLHRAGEVQQARYAYFMKTLGLSTTEAKRKLDETADKHTVSFALWLTKINLIVRDLAGVEVDDLPDAPFQAKYHLGVGALDMAKSILDSAYEF